MEIDLSAGLFVLKPSKDGPLPPLSAEPKNADILPEIAFTTIMEDETPEPLPEEDGVMLSPPRVDILLKVEAEKPALEEKADGKIEYVILGAAGAPAPVADPEPKAPLPASPLAPLANTIPVPLAPPAPHLLSAEPAKPQAEKDTSPPVSLKAALPDKPAIPEKTPPVAVAAAPPVTAAPAMGPPPSRDPEARISAPAISRTKSVPSVRPEPAPKVTSSFTAAPPLSGSAPLFQFTDIETPDLAPALKIEQQAFSIQAKPHPIHRAVPPVAAQISVQLQNQIGKSENQVIELRLDPPELGRVTVHITTHDQIVAAQITAERVDTVDLMRRHAEILTATLEKAGFSQANLSFQQGASGQDQENSTDFDNLALTADPHPAAPIAPQQLHADGRLDIRL